MQVRTEEVASRVAAALNAAKLIYITPGMFIKRDERRAAGESHSGVGGVVLQSMRLSEAKHLLKYYRAPTSAQPAAATSSDAGTRDLRDRSLDVTSPALPSEAGEGALEAAEVVPEMAEVAPENGGFEQLGTGKSDPDACSHMLQLCHHCVRALEGGVTRAHLLPPTPGAIIQELYTADGMGTLISRDLYDGIRLATPADVPQIVELIAPLERKGVLVTRDRGALARDVHKGFYYVFTRDTLILGCANLKRYTPEMAELGCLVVAPAYRKQGHGDAMLCYLERTAIAAGVPADQHVGCGLGSHGPSARNAWATTSCAQLHTVIVARFRCQKILCAVNSHNAVVHRTRLLRERCQRSARGDLHAAVTQRCCRLHVYSLVNLFRKQSALPQIV